MVIFDGLVWERLEVFTLRKDIGGAWGTSRVDRVLRLRSLSMMATNMMNWTKAWHEGEVA